MSYRLRRGEGKRAVDTVKGKSTSIARAQKQVLQGGKGGRGRVGKKRKAITKGKPARSTSTNSVRAGPRVL